MDYEKKKLDKIVNQIIDKYTGPLTPVMEQTAGGFDRIVYYAPNTAVISHMVGDLNIAINRAGLDHKWRAIAGLLVKANPSLGWRLEVTTQFKDGAPELVNNLLYFKIQGASQ